MSVPAISPATVPVRQHGLRLLIELPVCLVILVTLCRAYLAGGYMIETGSMAPCLLGRHRPVVCPECRFPFAVDAGQTSSTVVCPNCGAPEIPVAECLENDGDHLLVHRSLYAWRTPRRWEVIVFQNPYKPRQAYVKRLVGLPGESVRIQGGDVYVDGAIQTKDYATQCGLRIPVYDHNHRPPEDTPDWQPRWKIDPEGSRWSSHGSAFRFAPPADREASAERWDWVRYRHWVRSGGTHATSVRLIEWPESLNSLTGGFSSLRYDGASQTLVCRGALPGEVRDRLLAAFSDEESQQNIRKLYEASHIAPIQDDYGYNSGRDGLAHYEVRDLMLSLEVHWPAAEGEVALSLHDGAHEFVCVIDRQTGQVVLQERGARHAVRSTTLKADVFSRPLRVEMSLMDRQVLVAVGGRPAFEPWPYPAPEERGPTPWTPVRFGARGGKVDVDNVRLFRDVYYVENVGRRGVDSPAELGADEYFVLGDNSPVSKDSRSWTGAIQLTPDLLLGKPLVVHLPTRIQRVRLGELERDFRIPEFSRIRYIH